VGYDPHPGTGLFFVGTNVHAVASHPKSAVCGTLIAAGLVSVSMPEPQDPTEMRGRRVTWSSAPVIAGFASLIALLVVFSSAGAAIGSPSPSLSTLGGIAHVGLRWGPGGNVTVTIQGRGFGHSPVALPYYGNSYYLVIQDSAQMGHSGYGFGGDGNLLLYKVWTPTRIVVSSFFPSPGDAFEVVVWSTATGIGMTAGGNVPPRVSGEPSIRGVDFANSGKNLRITITGEGFGSAPCLLPFTGDLNYLSFTDWRIHFETNPSLFYAGDSNFGLGADRVTLVYTSWTDTKIVISGFAGSYSHSGAVVEKEDPVSLVVWNTSDSSDTGPQTAWGGLVT
jgi:hypothetical protein